MGSEENEQLRLRLRVQQILLMCGQSALLREPSLHVAKFKKEFDMVILWHWAPEKSLRQELVRSSAENRWEEPKASVELWNIDGEKRNTYA